MNKCNACCISVRDDAEICPLCGSVLAHGDDARNTYPNIEESMHSLRLALRIYIFAAFVLGIASLPVNLLLTPDFLWCIISDCILLTGGLVLYWLVNGMPTSWGITIILAAIILIGLADLSDRLLGNLGWSLNYAQPGLLLAAEAAVLVLMIVSPRTWQTYISVQLVIALLSLAAIPLFFCGQLSNPIVSLTSVAVTVLFFIGTLVIGGPRTREELSRRFHI